MLPALFCAFALPTLEGSGDGWGDCGDSARRSEFCPGTRICVTPRTARGCQPLFQPERLWSPCADRSIWFLWGCSSRCLFEPCAPGGELRLRRFFWIQRNRIRFSHCR